MLDTISPPILHQILTCRVGMVEYFYG